MDEQLILQLTAMVKAAMEGDQQATLQILKIMNAAKKGDEQAIAIAQLIQQIAESLKRAAKNGAKLGYLKELKGICPNGYEMQVFRVGGKTCKKCMKRQMEEGAKMPTNPVDAFKCGRKMKKKTNLVRKGESGLGDLPSAPSAKKRYSGGTYRSIMNTNPYVKNGFAYMGIPTMTDYGDVVVANDGNLITNPSFIAKGYDYLRGDSVALEVPKNSKIIEVQTANPVYKRNNPKEFSRLSRRTDEAKSVSKPKK